MWNFFERNHIPYNLRRGDLAFPESLLWNNLSRQVKEIQTLEKLKNRIKNLRYIHCPALLVGDVLIYK